MRVLIAFAVTALLPFLALNGVGQAQAQTGVEIQGTLEAVDCDQGAVVLSTSSGSTTFIVDGDTAAFVDSTSLPFCALEGYVGAPVTVWLVAYGGGFLATQIELTGPAAVAPYATEAITPLPIWGTVLGTILVAGLVYLLVHGPDNQYYRYPYYGAYYRHYYHRGYRPYQGYYPASAPIITVAWPITGVVLGTVIVNNYEYVLARDDGGHFYRYPYYGPYRQYYYRPTYRPYPGVYANVHVTNVVRVTNVVSVQVLQGDSHWDAPAAYASSHVNYFRSTPQRQPFSKPAPQPTNRPTLQRPQPTYQPLPQRQPDPVSQPAPQRQPQPTYQPTQQRPQPTYQPLPQPVSQPAPQRQPQPAYQPTQQRPQPIYENGRGNPHQSGASDQQCGGRQSNQSCSSGGPSQPQR